MLCLWKSLMYMNALSFLYVQHLEFVVVVVSQLEFHVMSMEIWVLILVATPNFSACQCLVIWICVCRLHKWIEYEMCNIWNIKLAIFFIHGCSLVVRIPGCGHGDYQSWKYIHEFQIDWLEKLEVTIIYFQNLLK